MVVTREVFALENGAGFGYRVLVDGAALIVQEAAPAVDGQVVMTEAQAGAVADAVVAQMSATRTAQEEATWRTLNGRLLADDMLTEAELGTLRALGTKGLPTLGAETVQSILDL